MIATREMQIKGTMGCQYTELLKWKATVTSNIGKSSERVDQPLTAGEHLQHWGHSGAKPTATIWFNIKPPAFIPVRLKLVLKTQWYI